MEELKTFLARQLNDHADSVRGVRQGTHFTWSEAHVKDALEMGLTYLFSIFPEEFSHIKEYTLQIDDCIVSFCGRCDKFMGVIDIEVNGKKCGDLVEVDKEEIGECLMPLLISDCFDSDSCNDITGNEYRYTMIDSSNCVIKFDRPVKKDSVIRYLCAEIPSLDDLVSDKLSEYSHIVAEYAAFWLYRTDSESKSNLSRANLHFEALRHIVSTKFQIDVKNTNVYRQKES